jgi:hypothetical protein
MPADEATPDRRCLSCGGSGKDATFACLVCKGDRTPPLSVAECLTCAGTGQSPCPACCGTGRVRGTGIVRRPELPKPPAD